MDDSAIIELYWQRSQQAITETVQKYGAYLTKIAMNIVNNMHDSEECVNDSYLKMWNTVPPNRPERIAPFIGKITRNLAINRYNASHAEKRAAGEYASSLEELCELVSDRSNVESSADSAHISRCISGFLRLQPDNYRRIFIRRYFYCESISEIAVLFKSSESKIKSILFRTRGKLKEYLEEEGIVL